jgi:hypothetical protein
MKGAFNVDKVIYMLMLEAHDLNDIKEDAVLKMHNSSNPPESSTCMFRLGLWRSQLRHGTSKQGDGRDN